MNRIEIIAIATRYPAWAAEAEAYYQRQIRRFSLVFRTVKPAVTPAKEAALVLGHLPKAAYCVLLEVSGKLMTSAQFAQAVGEWTTAYRTTVFIIGGADGVGGELRTAAQQCLSLSSLTFPHALARLVLVEQLFRADCTLRQHPYPR